jgi:hypothetical protein
VVKVYLEISRLLRNMGKSFNDYPTIPRIDTADVDDENVVDRAREKQRFQHLYRQMTADQKKITRELIRV